MAIWLEVRCERRGVGRSPYGNYRCWSDDNYGPGALAKENQRDVAATLRGLSQECLSAGWKKLKVKVGCVQNAAHLNVTAGRLQIDCSPP